MVLFNFFWDSELFDGYAGYRYVFTKFIHLPAGYPVSVYKLDYSIELNTHNAVSLLKDEFTTFLLENEKIINELKKVHGTKVGIQLFLMEPSDPDKKTLFDVRVNLVKL